MKIQILFYYCSLLRQALLFSILHWIRATKEVVSLVLSDGRTAVSFLSSIIDRKDQKNPIKGGLFLHEAFFSHERLPKAQNVPFRQEIFLDFV